MRARASCRVEWVVALFAALLVAGCGIPVSTLWRLHNFTVDRFFSIQPGELRAAVRVDEKARRGAGEPFIDVRVEPSDGAEALCYAFALTPVDAAAPSEPPLDPRTGRRWYAFRLSAAGLAAFDRAKRDVRHRNRGGASVALNVTMTKVVDPAPGASRFPIRIDLAFDKDVGYFTLVDETDLLQQASGPRPREDGAGAGPPAADEPCSASTFGLPAAPHA